MNPSTPAEHRTSGRREPAAEAHTADVIFLDDWRRPRRGQASSAPVRPAVAEAPRTERKKIPVDVLLLALILVSAIGGAMLALMYVGRIP